MLQNGTYKKTKDYIEQNIVFRQLEAVLSISKNGNKETNSWSRLQTFAFCYQLNLIIDI